MRTAAICPRKEMLAMEMTQRKVLTVTRFDFCMRKTLCRHRPRSARAHNLQKDDSEDEFYIFHVDDLVTRTWSTRGPRFGLNRPSTGDLSKWSLTPVHNCRSFRSVCTLRTLQTSNFHQAASCSRLTPANECGQQVPWT